MFKRRKGFSASQSKSMSRRMRQGMVGTHHAAPVRRSRHMNAEGVGFSSQRRQRRATRGQVGNVGVAASSGESARAHARRVSQRDYARHMQRKAGAQRVLGIALVLLAVAVVAVGVGVYVYFSTADSKLSLGDSNVENALVAPASPDDPYYVLMAAHLGAPQGAGGTETDVFMLAQVRAQGEAPSFVRIPSDAQVKLSDGNVHQLHEASSFGGDAALVEAVSSLAGVDIAHMVKVDDAGLQALVEAVGGVEVTLAEEVDDPKAGSLYIPAGAQDVTRDNVLVLLRAANFSGGIETQTDNQVAFTCELARKLLEAGGLDFVAQLDAVAGKVKTDLSSSETMDLAESLRGADWSAVQAAVLPGYWTAGDDATFVVSAEQAATLFEKLAAGEDIDAAIDPLVGLDPAEYTVEVRNGAGIAGGAARCADMLREAGFGVGNVGNSPDYVTYPETLVVYKDEANAQAAAAAAKIIKGGRVINGGTFYEFDDEVLVVIGQDWQPIV